MPGRTEIITKGVFRDERAYAATLHSAVTAVVRKQLAAGIDVIDDGEMGKSNWISYLYERTRGLAPRPIGRDLSQFMPPSRDRQHFPGAYARQDALDTPRRAQAPAPRPTWATPAPPAAAAEPVAASGEQGE
jgi:hypothetical protein